MSYTCNLRGYVRLWYFETTHLLHFLYHFRSQTIYKCERNDHRIKMKCTDTREHCSHLSLYVCRKILDLLYLYERRTKTSQSHFIVIVQWASHSETHRDTRIQPSTANRERERELFQYNNYTTTTCTWAHSSTSEPITQVLKIYPHEIRTSKTYEDTGREREKGRPEKNKFSLSFFVWFLRSFGLRSSSFLVSLSLTLSEWCSSCFSLLAIRLYLTFLSLFFRPRKPMAHFR